MVAEQNLYSAGEGIFETHVTWADIERNMQKALCTKASFGSNKSALNIGDGNGFLSRICLIDPDWQSVDETDELPKKFIAKISTAFQLVSFVKRMEESGNGNLLASTEDTFKKFDTHVRTLHNTEVEIYHLLNSYKVDEVPRAHVYYAKKYTDENTIKGYLLMSFMEDITSLHIWSNIAPNRLTQALKAIAAIQALTLQLHETEAAFFSTKPMEEIFGPFFDEGQKSKFVENLKGFGDEKTQETVRKLNDELDSISDLKFFDTIPDQLGYDRVLCHGDLWSTNILWTNGADGYKIKAMIDFQTSHIGNPAGDLSRLFCTCLSKKDRRENTDKLLETFYGYLKEAIGDHQKMPYTLDQLKESYKRIMPMACYLISPMAGGFIETLIDKKDEEEKEKIRHAVRDKLEALLEDMLEFDYRNKDLGLQ